jgi:hypothetical protein
MVVGATLATRNFGDVVLFGIVGLLGYLFKQADWPRVPLILGVILGRIVEPELFIAVDRWGTVWLWQRPIVLIILAMMVASVIYPAYSKRKTRGADTIERHKKEEPVVLPAWRTVTWWFGVGLVVIATIAAYKATDYVFRDSLLPWITCGWVIVFGGLHTALGLLRGQTLLRPQDVLASAKPMRKLAAEVLRIFLWVIGLLILVILVGHEVGVPLYIIVYMLAFGERLWVALAAALATAAFIHIVLVEFMHITFPTPYLWGWLGF